MLCALKNAAVYKFSQVCLLSCICDILIFPMCIGMKTKEIHSTGNLNYIIAWTADLKENLDRNRHFPIIIFLLQFIPKPFLPSMTTKLQQDVANS